MLRDIAADMMLSLVSGRTKATRKLSTGLELTLYGVNSDKRNDEHYRLKLYRPGGLVSPSEKEVEASKEAFFTDSEIVAEGYHPERRGGTAYWIKVRKEF